MISFAGLRFFTTPWTLGISLALAAVMYFFHRRDMGL